MVRAAEPKFRRIGIWFSLAQVRTGEAAERPAAEPHFALRPGPGNAGTRIFNGPRSRRYRPGRSKQRPRERMAADTSKRSSQAKRLLVRHPGKHEVRLCQCAGLVEDHGIDFRKAFQSGGDFKRIPWRKSRPVAITCTAGTASASAQGQVMINTEAATNKLCPNGARSPSHHTPRVINAKPWTAGA